MLLLSFFTFYLSSSYAITLPHRETITTFIEHAVCTPTQLPTSLSLFSVVEAQNAIDWSILIATITERKDSFQKLYTFLLQQICNNSLQHKVEIVFYRDNKELPVGTKRNALLLASKGNYISFVDDDDWVHDEYIKLIYAQLQKQPDCVSLTGSITYKGKLVKRIHSIKYQTLTTTDSLITRPPTHLNPMKRSIAIQFQFPELYFNEDKIWTMNICKSGLLKNEAEVTTPYYFYYFDPEKSATWKLRLRETQKYIQQTGMLDQWQRRHSTKPQDGQLNAANERSRRS